MREPALARRSAGTMHAAVRVRTLLVVFGLSVGGTLFQLAAMESAELGRQQDTPPIARWCHSAAVVNGKIYVIGGAGADNQPVASVEVYDPATGTWESRASMPTARALFGVGTFGGLIYAVGGTTIGRDKLAVVEAYDPATDTWTRRADMPTPRNALSAAVVDGKLYAIGGWGFDRPEGGWESVDPAARGEDFATVEIYDPATDSWAVGAAMPTPRNHMTACAVGRKIYVIGGGHQATGVDVALSQVGVYDTATNRWTSGADIPTPRGVPSSAVIDGRIFVTGGIAILAQGSSQTERMRNRIPVAVVEVYDPASDRWVTSADLATPRGWFSTSVLNGILYVVGGRSLAPDGGILEVDGTFPELEVYTPVR